jgi:tetraacyldisaccharide 4'-kinase
VSFKESLLWPLSLPYGAAAHLRRRLYRKGILNQQRLPGVVISVGNLTVGGTGKTPMVLWIAERLAEKGKRVGILTRGYKGGQGANGEATSDEAELLRERLGDRVMIGVGPDRYAKGQELSRRGVKWFVLDDGFQHLQLARDIDIVLIDAQNPFGGGRVFPAGRLREPRTALSRADAIVITRSTRAPAVEAAIGRDSNAPVFYAQTRLDSVMGVWSEGLGDGEARRRKLFAFCGIGNPSAFVADLRDWGFEIAGHRFFPDHNRYSPKQASEIEREASAAGATGLICTEKDVFNLSGVHWRSFDLFVCRISLQIEREDDFWRTIMTKAESGASPAR